MQLNIEQQKMIHSKNMGHALIKGVAGSGKTTVAVHRIPFLLTNYCPNEDDKILMVTFNKSLTKYINYIYNAIPEESQLTLFPSENEKKKLTIVNIDKVLYTYYSKYNSEHKLNLQPASDEQLKVILQQCIAEIKKAYPDIKLMDYAYTQFLRSEIIWMKCCDYMELEEYQRIDRIGRTSSTSEGPQKIPKNSRTREAIYFLMRMYNQKVQEQKLCGFDDRSLYALEYVKTHEVPQYTHIIIDESQDLSRVQLECLMHLYQREKPYSSILFVADTAQSIYDTSWLTRGRNFTSIGLDMTGKSNSLAKNYRTTTQIAEAAYSLIAKDNDIVQDENFVKPSLIDKQGNYPVLRAFSSLEREVEYVKQLIKEKLSKLYNYADIAVVARTNRLLQEVEKGFGKEIPNTIYSTNEMDFAKDDVKLLTMHSIKGLEFKAVILIGLSSKVIPNPAALAVNEDKKFIESMERKLLYVGMTRATERLYLSYHDERSLFLKEIDARYLKLQDSAQIRNFYQIAMKDYRFTDQLNDIYGKEEIVRQWFLQELVETYKYPLDLIKVEYKVQLFSKIGFVDIVIEICRNNKIIPYIMIEIKPYGTMLDRAVEQLKSYMSVTQDCCYGVICNGNDFIVLNRNFDLVEDIPPFDVSMMPTSIEHYEYVQLPIGTKTTFLLDEDNPKEIIFERNGVQEIYKDNRVVGINVYQRIAAGQPVLLNESIQEQMYLPYEWITSPLDSFAVIVRGDSMINANIHNGDYVIIKKQNSADSGQIVAVEVDGGTTLKTLRKMGNMCCLLPENDNYEPIVVDASMVRIIGIAVGVVKRS